MFLIGRWLLSRFRGPDFFPLVAVPSTEPWTGCAYSG